MKRPQKERSDRPMISHSLPTASRRAEARPAQQTDSLRYMGLDRFCCIHYEIFGLEVNARTLRRILTSGGGPRADLVGPHLRRRKFCSISTQRCSTHSLERMASGGVWWQ